MAASARPSLFLVHRTAISDHFLTERYRTTNSHFSTSFVTISHPFPVISGNFSNIPDHSVTTFPDHFLTTLDRSTPFHSPFHSFVQSSSRTFTSIHCRPLRGGTTGDHSATKKRTATSQTTHGRYNTGPQGQNTGRSHRQQQRTHKADVSRSFPEPRLSGLPF